MSIAYHKKNNKNYIQYTLRIEEKYMDKIREIAKNEDISINEMINQSLMFAIEDYEKQNKTS